MDTSTEPARPRALARRTLLGGGLALLAGTGGSAAWAYDRFLREKVEVASVSAAEEAAGTSATAVALATDGTYTATGYTSSTTTITLTSTATGTGSEALAWYAAEIEVSGASIIRSAFAQDDFGQNITEEPSAIAAAQDAVLAINGDYYGFRDTGIVIRNGVAYRDEPARDGLAFYADGRVEVYDETATSAQELLDAGVWQTLSFGPAVLVDGAVPDGVEDVEIDTNIGNHSIQGKQPRTAIGVIGDDHLVFLVVDGRSEGYSRGATLPELGEILAGLGCTTGYNLDGGGSSVMIFDGEIVNQPSNGGERATSDILYVAG
ncbi:phosphodiester glycosidase family protein [Brachybacterium sp. J144]|uniref:phosphodiester glycosidase family protein n=1 Tax=Brachybacterium sp. J144 TaxID=3116487 RepID=UPI002E7996A5|nr:phosphodiester glycosidase family protein [Brachybacterium sp. J144]MEE1650085.1 phosphodiester glycosidase family protein [Brachybacterium sp. J144]